jgi:hypothetical protein
MGQIGMPGAGDEQGWADAGVAVAAEHVLAAGAEGFEIGGDTGGVQVGVVVEQQMAADAVAAPSGPDGEVGEPVVGPVGAPLLQDPVESLLPTQHGARVCGRGRVRVRGCRCAASCRVRAGWGNQRATPMISVRSAATCTTRR